ncbi:hypothetical protein ABZY04_05140, partial [Streptomyces sp. NPDC002922]
NEIITGLVGVVLIAWSFWSRISSGRRRHVPRPHTSVRHSPRSRTDAGMLGARGADRVGRGPTDDNADGQQQGDRASWWRTGCE